MARRFDRNQASSTATPQDSSPGSNETNRDRIAERAYARYEARGRTDGDDLGDWFEAERQLRQPSSASHTAADERSAETPRSE